jgi:hypothetical protein
VPNKPHKLFEELKMLGQGAGLFRVEDDSRSKKEERELESHPWAARLKRLLHEAGEYGAHWVYFRLHSQTGGPRPEIFIFDENERLSDGIEGKELANLHKQLWNYGAVPLAFFIKPTRVDVFNLMSPPEFDEEGLIVPTPFDRLELAGIETLAMAGAAVKGIQNKNDTSWERFNSEYFDDGGFWDMPANRDLGDADQGALESMVTDMRKVRTRLTSELSGISNESERDLLIRRILIVILMVQFLKERGILPPDYFQENVSGSDSDFLDVLSEPKRLISA